MVGSPFGPKRSRRRKMVFVPVGQGDDERLERAHWQQSRSGGGHESDDTDLEEEMMRIDPGESEWRRQLHVGDHVDAQNVFGNWCPARILRIASGDAHIQYLNMNDSWLRWLPLDSGQLARPATRVLNDAPPVRLAQQIEVRRSPVMGLWKEARAVRVRPSDLLVRYDGRMQQFDEWIAFTPDTMAPLGDHLESQHRRFAMQQRQLKVVTPVVTRHRMIEQENPRFVHYRDALRAQSLRIHAVEGDGNCLFRAVSHQIYGDDRHHAVVRAKCMDYMECEKEYFEPYVVGDMTAFMRYLRHKRRDGVWGDDPEIQAMCELYDRPAEVYAYDATLGYRKLRTFHENTALARDRPAIRLSYYGGGHYDSLVDPNHAANCVREEPGEWERRRIEYSHRINTRGGMEPSEVSGQIERHVQLESDRETTEMAQVEHILMLSRNEFDAMNSNLEDTLKLSLEEAEQSSSLPAGAVDVERRAIEESEIAATQEALIAKAKQVSEEEQMKRAIEESLRGSAYAHSSGFDDEMSAAIQASMTGYASSSAPLDEEEEMRRVLALSAQEYSADAVTVNLIPMGLAGSEATNSDEMDELQRAIQASLQQS